MVGGWCGGVVGWVVAKGLVLGLQESREGEVMGCVSVWVGWVVDERRNKRSGGGLDQRTQRRGGLSVSRKAGN